MSAALLTAGVSVLAAITPKPTKKEETFDDLMANLGPDPVELEEEEVTKPAPKVEMEQSTASVVALVPVC